MKRTTILAAIVMCLGIAQQTSAAEMTLVRNSRPVTAAEAASGAPSNGMVHDFFATSSADVLCIGTSFSTSVYKHPYATDYETPDPELIAMYPAVGASSFLKTPGSTFKLGGGLNSGAAEKTWGDLENDGPQTQYQFGRLTTSQTGAFAGSFFLRGDSTYIEMPFSFTLPGPLGLLTESIFVSGAEQRQTPYTPPEPSQTTREETAAPKPRHLEPSRSEQLKAWTISLSPPSLPSPPTSEILASVLAFKESRQQNLPKTMLIAEAVISIPEPASWMLASIALPLLIRRRSA